ncbi:MAG: RNA polymerase sigma factor, partial [Luteolibacter sp.]
METPRSDEQLLRDFTESGDQAAFRQLVDRYSGLIYHTALRIWNDRTLAEDVSQRVLGVLATKSSQVLKNRVPLSAWLHRTTTLEAKFIRRKEARHHRKKEALMLEYSVSSTSSEDSTWREAIPLLDEAIDSLRESDRQVILLHHVEGLTFPQVAKRLGKSTAAVQKQAQRALLKLQGVFGRRGITLSVGLLATGLTTEMAKAAPLALTTSFAAKASIGKISTQAIVMKKASIAAVGATVLLCGAPLASQRMKIQRLEERNMVSMEVTGVSSSGNSRPSSVDGNSRLRDLSKDLLGQDRNVVRYLSAVEYIESLTNEKLGELMLECVNGDLSSIELQPIFRICRATIAERDPAYALAVLLKKVPSSFYNEPGAVYFDQFSDTLGKWATNDPYVALEWFRSHLDTIREIPVGDDRIPGKLEIEMRLALSHAFIFSDVPTAVEILSSVPEQALRHDFQTLARNNFPGFNEGKEILMQVAREMLSEDLATMAVASCAGHISYDPEGVPDFSRSTEFLENQELSEAEHRAVILRAGALSMQSSLSKGKLEAVASHYGKWLEDNGITRTYWHVGAALADMHKNWSGDLDVIFNYLKTRGELGDESIAGFLETVDRGNRIDPER